MQKKGRRQEEDKRVEGREKQNNDRMLRFDNDNGINTCI